jgi:hypothetical protein
MEEYRDKIPAARGKVEYIYEEGRGISASISHSEPTFFAMYQVALSIDGTRILCTVPVGGIGQTVVAPQPSVPAFVQSDVQGMWGRNCPACAKYFRSEQIVGDTTCPYCSVIAPDLAFVSNDQKRYLTVCYDAFANAHMKKQTTSVDLAEITDEKSAWHYSEEKQQLTFKCQNTGCKCRTDVLGEYAFCPRCGRSNAGERFFEASGAELTRLDQVRASVTDRHEREVIWEQMTTGAVSRLEALAKHLRKVLLLFPMTENRRRQLQQLNFQKTLESDTLLQEWFDIGFFEWPGDDEVPKRQITSEDQEFIRKMIQKRHILIHNGGIVDEEYIRLVGDTTVRLDERVRIRSNETKRFLTLISEMARNLLNNIERGFQSGEAKS